MNLEQQTIMLSAGGLGTGFFTDGDAQVPHGYPSERGMEGGNCVGDRDAAGCWTASILRSAKGW